MGRASFPRSWPPDLGPPRPAATRRSGRVRAPTRRCEDAGGSAVNPGAHASSPVLVHRPAPVAPRFFQKPPHDVSLAIRASPASHLHQVGQRTLTSRLSNILGTEKKGPDSMMESGPFDEIRRRPTLPRGDHAVPSALEGLTAVFGMGTGVTPPPLPPEATPRESSRAPKSSSVIDSRVRVIGECKRDDCSRRK